AGSRIRLPLKESDIPVAVNPKSADGPSNNPQCGFWDSQFSAAQVKSVEQPWGSETQLKCMSKTAEIAEVVTFLHSTFSLIFALALAEALKQFVRDRAKADRL